MMEMIGNDRKDWNLWYLDPFSIAWHCIGHMVTNHITDMQHVNKSFAHSSLYDTILCVDINHVSLPSIQAWISMS